MNPFEMVIAIVAIVTIGNVVRTRQMARYGIRDSSMGRMFRRGRGGNEDGAEAIETAETLRLRDEVKELKERLKVLERITVEKENSLSREIEQLRDR